MSQPAIREPGPDHPITVTPFAGRVQAFYNGRAVADSRRAVKLKEASYPAVYYIPREDTAWDAYVPSAHSSTCPYKGMASYFSLAVDGRRAENAVWSYETPYPAVAAIAGLVAFYPERVDGIEVTAN